MIKDRNINWLRKRYRIPWNFWNAHAINAAGAGTEQPFANTTGNPVWQQLSSFGYGGISIGAANDLIVHCDLHSPTQFDPAESIGVRVLWCVEGTVALTDAVTWRVRYKQVDIGEVLTAGTDTALDTVIAAQSPTATTTLKTYRSSRGVINAGKFDHTARAGMIVWTVDVPTLTAFSADEVVFLGLELDFCPLLCTLSGENLGSYSADLAAGV